MIYLQLLCTNPYYTILPSLRLKNVLFLSFIIHKKCHEVYLWHEFLSYEQMTILSIRDGAELHNKALKCTLTVDISFKG